MHNVMECFSSQYLSVAERNAYFLSFDWPACGENCLGDGEPSFGDLLDFTAHYECTLSNVFSSGSAFKCFIYAELPLSLWGFLERLINDVFFFFLPVS